MPRPISSGDTAIITWAEPTVSLTGSAFDVTGTTLFYFDDAGTLQSFRSGRNPAFNNLTQVQQWYAYQVSAGGNLSLPDSTLGFGNAPA